MKKSTLLLLFMLSFGLSDAVQGQESVRIPLNFEWITKEVKQSAPQEFYRLTESFTNGNTLIDRPDLTNYHHSIKLDRPVKTSTKLVVSDSDLADPDLYPSLTERDYSITTRIEQAGRDYYVHIFILPLKKTSEGVARIHSGFLHVEFADDPIAKTRGPERTHHSVLETGDIYKLAVSQDGIYKLTAADLTSLGINTAGLDPRNLQLFTNYGGPLPERISLQNPDDLIEIPIEIVGEQDGKFDNSDAMYFYSDGPDKWQWKNGNYIYNKNIYDEKHYLFLKVGTTAGKRMASLSGITAERVATAYDRVQIYEEDRVNLLGSNAATEGSGKMWFGEKFTAGEIFNLAPYFSFSDRASSQIKINGLFASRAGSTSSTELAIDGQSFTKQYSSVSLTSVESEYARKGEFSYSTDLVSAQPSFTIKYNAPSDGSGWLDFISVQYARKVVPASGPLYLRNSESLQYGSYGYDVSSLPAEYRFWDVTDLGDMVGLVRNDGKVAFNTNNSVRTIAAFSQGMAAKPELIGKIANQNVHGIDFVDMVVIYPAVFKAQADKFIKHRSTHSNLDIMGVDVAQIYQEFSSGRQDPTAIRDFAKMLYDRNPSFRYMLLIGDGTYDQRRINTNIPDHRFIPVYETDESLNPIRAFPTDDYYALLSDNEGVNLDGALDIAVGRLTVTTPEEAESVINKIILYDTSPNRFGDWRLRSTFTADDEDSNTHLRQMDGIVKEVNVNFPFINDQKVYFDAYRQETTPGGQRYPEVEATYHRNMDRGHLSFCYLGHGGPKGWAQERVLKVSDIQNWKNINNQTIIITATCSFTGYDDPEVKSAGEYALLNGKGGAVALFTTVRAVYASENERLTKEVFRNIYRKIDGEPMTFGNAITIAKNTNKQDTVGENSRKFSLIGDPSQRIALPRYDISVDEINNADAATFSDTLGALEIVKVKGKILDFDGSQIQSFNGKIFPTVFDKRSTIETLGNDNKSPVTKIDVLKNILFKGVASVVNGAYEFSFVVPKDINYTVGYGKMSLYATDGTTTDAGGYYNGLLIGGSGNAVSGDEGPEIRAYINDVNFTSGDVVSPNAGLLLYLSDDLGINVTGTSIGHDLTAAMTGPVEGTFVLNEFYEASLDDYTSGSVFYPLGHLPEGNYSIRVKAWDISNNSAETTIHFTVSESTDKHLFDVISYPNPFSDRTAFAFSHDLGNTDAEITVNIFSVSGQLVKTLRRSMNLTAGRVTDLDWSDEAGFESSMINGLYLYKIKVYSPSLGISRESKFQKLVKI